MIHYFIFFLSSFFLCYLLALHGGQGGVECACLLVYRSMVESSQKTTDGYYDGDDSTAATGKMAVQNRYAGFTRRESDAHDVVSQTRRCAELFITRRASVKRAVSICQHFFFFINSSRVSNPRDTEHIRILTLYYCIRNMHCERKRIVYEYIIIKIYKHENILLYCKSDS